MFHDFAPNASPMLHLSQGDLLNKSPHSQASPFHYFTPTKDIREGLSVMYTNIDTFLNKREELHYKIIQDNPDIICITEILAKTTKQYNPCEYQIPNNTSFCGHHKNGG